MSNEEFESWHVHLCETVGEENLTIVTELLPDLKMITDIGVDYGNRNILEEEDESSGKNDFIEAFVSFFSAIARPQHPLVMFLDDIEVKKN